jgi:predicted phosphodiesterase
MTKSFIFLSDTHAQDHLPQAIALAAARMRDTRPNVVLFGGDMVEFDSMTDYARMRVMEDARHHTLKQEARSCVEGVLDPLREAAPDAEAYMLEGNHEFRALRYVANRALALEGIFDLADLFACKRLGIKYIPSKAGNAQLVLGPVRFMHGQYCGANPAKMHLEKFGGPCIVFGHTHRQGYHRDRKGNGRDEVSIGAGCLCKAARFSDLDNYMRGWVEGWFNEQTGEFGVAHANVSGQRWDYLYTPEGEYSAKCIHGKDGSEKWVAERVRDSRRKAVQAKGRSTAI